MKKYIYHLIGNIHAEKPQNRENDGIIINLVVIMKK